MGFRKIKERGLYRSNDKENRACSGECNMIETIKLISKTTNAEISHLKKQRIDKRVWPCLFIEFNTEDEAKKFCENVENDPIKLAKAILGDRGVK